MATEDEIEDRIADAIGEWFERRDTTDPLDPEVLIRRHPEIADELRAHLKFLDRTGALEEPPALPPELPPELGGCRLVREIGEGGMGRVFRALDPGGTPVAVKVLRPHLFHAPSFVHRFRREAEVGQRIDHPNVVRTLAVGAQEHDGRVHRFLVLELVCGGSLRELLDAGLRMDEVRCRSVAVDVASALGAIHAAGAVHRDIKPENLLLTQDGHVKVTDLGVARLEQEAVRISQTGGFVGSLSYGAPEQFSGTGRVDCRADLHALGVVLHELATGQHPFGSGPPGIVIPRILTVDPLPLRDVSPEHSPELEAVVRRLLAKSPRDRFSSADEVVAALVT